MSLASRTDEELLSAYARGEAEAFEELYRRYRKPIFAFVHRFVSNPETAAELHQEVFLRVVRASGEFAERSKFSTWLYRIARNLCIDHLRRASHRQTRSLDQPRAEGDDDRRLEEVLADPKGDVERQVTRGELRKAIERAVAALPEDQREVFLLREVAGLAYKEIAEVVGCPENTAKSRMRYALERLRAALAHYEELASTAGTAGTWGRR